MPYPSAHSVIKNDHQKYDLARGLIRFREKVRSHNMALKKTIKNAPTAEKFIYLNSL